MGTFFKILKDSFTVSNGQDFDLGRILWVQAALTFLGLAVYSVVFKGQTFDPSAYGTGLGLVMAGGGAALGFKSMTEPR
jgi:hypothetical protein